MFVDNEEPLVKRLTRNEEIERVIKKLENYIIGFIASEKFFNNLIKTRSPPNEQFMKEMTIFKENFQEYLQDKKRYESFDVRDKKLNDKFESITLRTDKKADDIQKLINDIVLNEENMMNQNENALIPPENDKKEEEVVSGSVQSGSLTDQIFVQEILDKDDFLKKRRERLNNIKQVSSTIREMSKQMAIDVDLQGKMLNNIEDQVVEVVNKTEAAEKEIVKASEGAKKNNKKIIIMIIGIVFFVIVVVGLAVYLLFPRS